MIQKAITVRTILELGQDLEAERRRAYALEVELRNTRIKLETAMLREADAWRRQSAAVHEAEVLRRQLGNRGIYRKR